MSLLLLFNQPAGGGGSVTANLAVVDTADTLASSATITAAPGVSCTLSVSDTSDSLASSATITGVPIVEDVNLGGRNKLFDTPGRRILAALRVQDDDDRLQSRVVVPLVARAAIGKSAALNVVDEHDAVVAAVLMADESDKLMARCSAVWPERHIIRTPRRGLVSSRYEAVA